MAKALAIEPDRKANAAESGDDRDARLRIIDAAEAIFAQKGFDGAGMKAIAAEAGVAQGLLHYHFANKDGLYAAVVERRAAAVNEARLAALGQVDFSAPDALEAVFHALLAPPLTAAGGGRTYARIFAVLAVGLEREQALVRQYFDPTAKRFIEAIQRAEPGVDQATAAWGYSFAIGSLVMVVGRTRRIERLAGESAGREASALEIVARLVDHSCAGLRGLAAGSGRRRRRG